MMWEEEVWGAVRVSVLARCWYGGGGAVSQGKQGGLWKLKRQEMDSFLPPSPEPPRGPSLPTLDVSPGDPCWSLMFRRAS